jgi:hypothetical protein
MNASSSTPNRRDFLHFTAMSLAIASTSHISVAQTPGDQAEAEKTDITNEVDVLVIGGGSAGVIAAIQSGRAGADTLLLERNGQLGGTITTGGVAFPGLFDAWGKQIISGIGWELVKECVDLDGGKLPDFNKVPARHWQNQVHVNQFLYAILAEEKCQQANVTVAYYEFPAEIRQGAEGRWQVTCLGFGTRRNVICKQIVDCTGGAEVVGMLGHARLREDERQPGSYLFQLGQTHIPASEQLHRLYVHGADSTNSRTATAANLTGRKEILAKVRKTGKRLMHMQPETGFRESYRIVGETMITVNDYTSGRVFDDAIAYAFYPVDLHTKSGVKPKPLKPGVVPTISYGALIPKDSQNIIVAGRCISSDRLANSGLRVQASCMAMGQAAGAAAALCARQSVSPAALPINDLRSLLREHHAIVPGKV